MSSDPEWLSEGTTTSAAPTPQQSTSNAAVSSSSSGNDNSSSPPYKTTLQITITVFMMGAAVMMACAGALGIKNANSVSDTGLVFIGLYMHIFAAILFCYEAIQIRPCDVLDTFYKRNFGFLYGPNGKGAYLIFAGVMAFGIQSPRTFAIATGVVVGFLGVVLILVNAKWPEYFDKHEKYHP